MNPRAYSRRRRNRRLLVSSQAVSLRVRAVQFERLEPRLMLAQSIWDGGGDGRSWLDPLNWSDDALPPRGADVTIPNVARTTEVNLPTNGSIVLRSLQSAEPLVLAGATLSLDDVSTIGQLTMTSGTITGAGALTVSGPFDWRGGTISSQLPTTEITLTGGLTVSSGSRTLSARTLVLDSDTQWTGGEWRIDEGATIVNRPGSVFSFDSVFLNDVGAGTTETLINEGTLRKTAGAGTATLEFDLLDLRAGGRVESLVGTINVVGSFVSAGHWEAAEIAVIDWQYPSGQSQLRAGTTSAGKGAVRLINGTVTVVDPVTLGGPFVQENGTFDGPGTLTLAGPFTWNGGTQRGTGADEQTIVTGGLTIASNSRTLNARTLVLASDTQWTGGEWRIDEGATIVNRPGSVLSFDSVFLNDVGASTTETLINEGTLRKTAGAGTATLEFDLLDLRAGGRVESLVGTINVVGSFVSAGHWEAAESAVIDWQYPSGQSQLRAGTTSAGKGAVRLINGTVTVVDPVTLGGPFVQNSGTFDGPGALTLAGPFTWNGGTQRGTEADEQTIVMGGLTIASSSRTLNARTLVLDSDTQWTGGEWRIDEGATIVNRPGSVFSFDSVFLNDVGANTTETLFNEGTLRKTAGAGTATFESATVNLGAIVVHVGLLHFSEALIQESGSITLAGGNIRSSILIDVRGGMVAGNGQLQGRVKNAGHVRPGDPLGSFDIVGDFEQTASGVLDFQWGGTPTAHDRLDVTGQATLAGTLRVSAIDGFVPDTGTAISPLTFGSRVGEFTNVEGFLGTGRSVAADYSATSVAVTVTESSTNDAEIARQQLSVGMDVLRQRLGGWSQLMGLPDARLPLIGNGFDQALGLLDQFSDTAQAGLPALTQEVLDFEALRTALEGIGLTVICVAGEVGCQNGENVLVQFDQTLEDLETDIPFDSVTPDVLKGLGEDLSLQGSLSIATDVVFSIVFGVDSLGFFLDGSSSITLADFTIDGSVSGAGNIGDEEAIALSGTANAGGNFNIDLIPASLEDRYRTDVLWTDPMNFLRVDVEGDAQLALGFEIGPAVMTWEGLYQVSTNDTHEIDVQLDEMFLSGTFSLPELKQFVNGVPEEGFIQVDAHYRSETDNWHIDAVSEASAVYQLGGLTIKELDFDADAGPGLFAGEFTAVLEVPFGDANDPLVVDVDVSFGSQELSGTTVTSFNERYMGGTLLWLQGFSLTTFVEAHFEQPSLQLDFLVTADHAVLFIDEPASPGAIPAGVATVTGFRGALSRTGVLDIRIDEASADFSAFTITATGDPEDVDAAIHLVIGPGQPDDAVVLAIHEATLEFPLLEKPLSLTATNLRFTRGGLFSMDQAELVAETGILDTLGFAGFLPLDVVRVHVSGISNTPFTTDDFSATITIDGTFDFSYLADTPLKNLQVTIGEQDATNEFSFVFTVSNGQVDIQNTGPITVAIADMEFGPLVLNASLTVGAYVDGEFLDNDDAKGVTFSGFFDALWMQEEASVGAGVAINEGQLDLLADSTRLAVNATFDVTFAHPDSPLTFEDLGLTFDLQLEVSKSFEVLSVDLTVLNATADSVEIHFGDLFRMHAGGVVFDFTVFDLANVADVPFATFGSLEVQFGDPDAGEQNPLSGLGGSAGNFGIGFVPGNGDAPPRPRFFQLPDFFLELDIPNVFPSWLPIDLDEFGFKFPDADVIFGDDTEPVKIDKLDNATILASGGMRGTDIWPITGLVEDMEFSIQDIQACGQYLISNNMLEEGETVLDGIERNLLAMLTSGACPFPVKNLDAVEIAIEPIEIGGVAIGGGLGLGILDIDVNGDGDTNDPEDTTAFYGRILGQLVYSDMGFGAEVIVTQYGPVLGRLYVGIPVPIGGLVGAVVGAFFFGVGAAAGYQIGDRTGFILTGFEGGMTFGDPLATIEDPLDILHNNQIHAPLKVDLETTKQKVAEAVRNQERTWDSGFTLAVSGVLTNTYVNGMIGSRVTLGANVGYGEEVGFQLYGISDVVEVADIPVVSAGILFDFTDPHDPSQFNPLSPTVNMAFAMPGTRDSVLAMLLPAKAELGIQLTTDGVADATIAAAGQFVHSLIDGTLEFGQAIFDTALTNLAGLLEAERSARQAADRWSTTEGDIPSRLLHLIIDSNANDVLSPQERAVVITRDHFVTRIQQILAGAPARAATLTESFVSRLLDAATRVVGQLGNDHAAVQQLNALNSHPYFLERLSDLAETLPIEFYQPTPSDPPAGWPALPKTAASLQPLQQAAQHAKEIYAAFAYHVQQAILASAETFFEIADPAVTINGALQPYLLGIPLGDPLGQVEGRLDKHGVTLSVDTTVGTLFNAATLVGSLMGAPDIPVGMTVSLPIGDTIQSVLFDGATFPLLDPEDQRWLIELRTGLRVANFDVATIKGIGFPAGAANEESLLSRLQKLFEDPDAEIDDEKIPIQTSEHFEAITTHGGLLLSGILQVPKLITDPFALLESLDLEVPENVLEYPAWLNDMADKLTAIDTPGQFQLFAPSIAAGLTLNLQDPCGAGGDCDESDRIARDENAIADIIADAYVEGTWEGKLLGIPLGRARIEGTTDGLAVDVEDPLLGLDVTVLASIDERVIGDQTVMFPRARAEVTLDTDQAFDLLDKLHLPSYLREDFVDAAGTLRWYSPGYSSDPQEPDRLKRVGGIEAEGLLNANLFNVFEATFAGSLDSSGGFSFEANDLSLGFELGIGAITGMADFSIAGAVDSPNVDFQGDFAGSLKVGRKPLASVAATIDPYGCLRGTLSYLDGSGTVDMPDHPLQPGACGPQLLVDDVTVTEGDENTTESLVVRLTTPAINDVTVTYHIEPVSDHSDPRDKATENDVVFKAQAQHVTIPKGQLQATIPVTIKGDNVWETNEIFRVRVSSAPGALLAAPVGIVTIVDDDLDNLVDSVLDAIDPSARAIVWFDFQDDDNIFDATADDAPPVILSTDMTHSLAMEAEGRTGLPGHDGHGRGASSTQWSNQEGYFEFTVTFNHDEPLDVRFDHLQFWDRTAGGKINQRFTGPQEWQVYTSLDGFQTPLPREQSIVINSEFFADHNLPTGTELDDLLGWRRQRFMLESSLDPGYVSDLPLDVTYRLVGLEEVPTVIDNVELAGRVIDPCESDLESSCLARLVDDTVRWLDSLVGRVEVRVIGPGTLAADLLPRGDDIDPTRIQELISLEVLGADPARTTVLVEVERPGDLPAGASLPLGTIRSDNGLLRLDLSAVPVALATIDVAGPLGEVALAGLADGSRVQIGGNATQLTTITARGDIGSADGIGVDLVSAGTVAAVGKSWGGGTWDVASVTTARFAGGDFSPTVFIDDGFDSFTVIDGDFAPPIFTSGRAAPLANGGGNAIQTQVGSNGTGGSILVGLMTIDGDLQALEAVGGKISTNLTAERIGTIRANRSARIGDAGNIEGRLQGASMDLVESLGGVISATLVTTDSAHRDLRVHASADPNQPGSGRIDSQRSFAIAGGVAALRAHDMALRLVAGGRVELVELIGEEGSFVADLTARSYGRVEGRTAHLDLALRTPYTEQPPVAGTFFWEVVSGANGSLLSFQVTELERQATLKFTVDEHGQPQFVELEQVTPALVDENVAGATIGVIGVPSLWEGEPLTIVISDPRFELRNGQLALNVADYLQAGLSGGELVDVSARTADGASRWLETFVVSIGDNPFPWHNKSMPLDSNGSSSISPLDALLVINYLNAGLPRTLPSVRPAAGNDPVTWYDIAADGLVTPLDALLVINELNRIDFGEGEATSPDNELVPALYDNAEDVRSAVLTPDPAVASTRRHRSDHTQHGASSQHMTRLDATAFSESALVPIGESLSPQTRGIDERDRHQDEDADNFEELLDALAEDVALLTRST
ncbi:MAG: dockerin type I domain-containing protein [Pirellulaceae bacterium]